MARDRVHPGLDIRPRKPARQYLLDHFARLAAGLGEQRFGVLFGQVRGEQEETRQVQGSAAELFEHARQPLCQSGYPSALQCFILAVTEAFDAECVEGRAGLLEKQLPALDFYQVLDDVGDGRALAVYQSGQARQQVGIGDGGQGLHAYGITRVFGASLEARSARFALVMSWKPSARRSRNEEALSERAGLS